MLARHCEDFDGFYPQDLFAREIRPVDYDRDLEARAQAVPYRNLAAAAARTRARAVRGTSSHSSRDRALWLVVGFGVTMFVIFMATYVAVKVSKKTESG